MIQSAVIEPYEGMIVITISLSEGSITPSPFGEFSKALCAFGSHNSIRVVSDAFLIRDYFN